MASSKELSAFDHRLLDLAASGKSPTEMSRALGGTLNAAEVRLRVSALLTERNWTSALEKKQLAMFRLQQVVDELLEISRASQDSGDYSALLRALDQQRKALDAQSALTEDELKRMTRAQAEQMVEFLTAAISRAREILQADYPDVPDGVLEEAMQEAMVQIAADDVHT